MKKFIHINLLIAWATFNHLSAQPLYSNYYLNPLGTWSVISGGAIILNDTTYIAGIGGGPGFEKVIIFLKLDSDGEIVFMRTYGEPYYRYYQGFKGSFRAIDDHNFIFVIVKLNMITNLQSSILYYLDHNFDTLFSKEFTIADGVNTLARQIIPAFDEGYFVTGMHSPLNDTIENTSFFILKTDAVFNIEWQQSYSLAWRNEPLYMLTTPDNGLLISGFTGELPTAYSKEPLVIKADSLGNILWIWNEGSIYDDGWAVVAITCDGNYLAAYTHAVYQAAPHPVPPSQKILRVLKFSPDGDILWQKDYGSATIIENAVSWIHSYDDGTHLIGGYQWNDSVIRWDSYILKINNDGDSLWMRFYEHEDATGIAKFNQINHLTVTPGNGILATGQIIQLMVPGGVQAMWIMHLDSLGCVVQDCDPTLGLPLAFHENATGFSVYPNPATNICYIRIPENLAEAGSTYFLINIYNYQGVLVYQTQRKNNGEIISLDTAELPRGLYLLHFIVGSETRYRTKLIVQ